MVGPFPLFKLGILAAKQISRPISNILKKRAKANKFINNYVCSPPGQLYHLWDTRLKLRILGLEKPKKVTKLSPEAAADVGAEIIGEFIMFSFGTVLLLLEYRRQSKNEYSKENLLEARFSSFERTLDSLEEKLELQTAQLETFIKQLENR